MLGQHIKHAEHAEEDIIRPNNSNRAGPLLLLINHRTFSCEFADLICSNIGRCPGAIKDLAVACGLLAQFGIYMSPQFREGDKTLGSREEPATGIINF